MMALNRYRLKHLKASGHSGARKASRLIKRPDRLLGLILIGNNVVNIAAASLATIICIRLFGGTAGPFVATGVLTIIVLIFAEVTPKTFAALYPEKIAFPAAHILQPMQVLLHPFIWVTNAISNGLIKSIGGRLDGNDDGLSFDELRSLVRDSGSQIPIKPRGMLMNILDLETMEVEDIMIPRNEIYAININDDCEGIFAKLRASEYTRVLVYRDELDDLVGVLHLRNISKIVRFEDDTEALDKRALIEAAAEPYFVPEGTPLHTQLTNFQNAKRRLGVVVDEYGVVLGIVAIEDILEEIVGNFTTNFAEQFSDITSDTDGNHVINGSANIRDINKELDWQLPTEGPKTLNGLLLEKLEGFPDAAGVSLTVENYLFEIMELQDNRIHRVNAQALSH